jgi:hypothetical protein
LRFDSETNARSTEPPAGAPLFELSRLSAPRPSQQQIRSQSERILNSPAFTRSSRSRRLLEYLLAQTLEGNAKRLKQYAIATGGPGPGPRFRPQYRSDRPAGSEQAAPRPGEITICARELGTTCGFRSRRAATFRLSSCATGWTQVRRRGPATPRPGPRLRRTRRLAASGCCWCRCAIISRTRPDEPSRMVCTSSLRSDLQVSRHCAADAAR